MDSGSGLDRDMGSGVSLDRDMDSGMVGGKGMSPGTETDSRTRSVVRARAGMACGDRAGAGKASGTEDWGLDTCAGVHFI